jgi:gas vesicle protein
MKHGLLVLLLCVGMSGLTGCKKEGDASDSNKADPSDSSISNLIDETAEDGANAISDLSEKVDTAIKEAENKVTREIGQAAKNVVENMASLSMTLSSIKDKKTAEFVSDKIGDLIGKMQASARVLDQADEDTQVQALLPYREQIETFAAAIHQQFQRLKENPDVMAVLGETFQKLSGMPGVNAGTE